MGMRSFLLGGLGLLGIAAAAAMAQPVINFGPNHSRTVYRRSGARAHRNWKRARASGITPRVRHG